jgi:hypothetical protein
MSLKKVETLNFLHLHPCQPFKTVFLFSSSSGGVLKCLVLSTGKRLGTVVVSIDYYATGRNSFSLIKGELFSLIAIC